MAFSMKDNFIIVNYHYVENPRSDFSGIHPCSVQEFERQVSFLAKNFSFVSIPELFATAKRNEHKKFCAITFDDGLKDQYDNAVPILKEHHASGTFFIITATLQGRVPLAHKIHTVASRISMDDLREKFNLFLSRDFPDLIRYSIPKDHRLTDKRRYDDVISANVKETLMIVPRKVLDAFFVSVLGKLGIDERELAKKLFMNLQEIQTLDKEGFFIESHTHNHYSLNNESVETLREDIQASNMLLKTIRSRPPTVMSYPHGRSLPETRTVLASHGFTHGVTIERRAIAHTDDYFLIPRFDTNDVRDFLIING